MPTKQHMNPALTRSQSKSAPIRYKEYIRESKKKQQVSLDDAREIIHFF